MSDWLLVGFVVLLILGIGRYLEEKGKLLNSISDDLWQIKRELGLQTEARTPWQRYVETREAVESDLREGKSLKEIKTWLKQCSILHKDQKYLLIKFAEEKTISKSADSNKA